MPRLRLKLNIGLDDKKRLGLSDVRALEGDVVDVDDPAAELLVKNSWGEIATAEAAKAKGAPKD